MGSCRLPNYNCQVKMDTKKRSFASGISSSSKILTQFLLENKMHQKLTMLKNVNNQKFASKLLCMYWDIIGISSGRPWDILRTSSGHPRDTLGTSSGHPRDILGTFPGHPRDILWTSSGHPQIILIFFRMNRINF